MGFSHRTDADNDRTLASQPRYQSAGPLAEVPRRVRTNQLPRRFSIRKRSPRLITPLVTGSPRARKKNQLEPPPQIFDAIRKQRSLADRSGILFADLPHFSLVIVFLCAQSQATIKLSFL